MKSKFNNKYVRWGVTAFLVIAAAIAFYYFIFHSSNIKAGLGTVANILMPVVFGLATAYLLTPILNFVEVKILLPLCRKCKLKETPKRKSLVRGTGILITAFLFVMLIYLLFAMLISQIVPSIQGLIKNFDTYVNNVISWINKTLEDNPEFSNNIVKNLDRFSKQLEGWLNDIIPNTAAIIRTVSISVINVLDVLWNFIIGFIISIYVLASKEHFAGQAKKMTYALFEKHTANMIIRNFRFTHQTFIGFLGGKIVDSIIIGILCFVGTTILQTPYAVLVSVIIGVTNVIPFFGPYLGAIPTTILIFVVDPTHPLNCVYFVIFILILQQFDGNFLGPKILGSSTGLTGFWVIFSITFFGGLFGILGMIVGVPIFAVIYAAVKSVINNLLEKKELPTWTKDYETVEYVDESGPHQTIQEPKLSGKKQHSFSFQIYRKKPGNSPNYENTRHESKKEESYSTETAPPKAGPPMDDMLSKEESMEETLCKEEKLSVKETPSTGEEQDMAEK